MILARDNRYSRFVAWSKIILPLMALAILSSLFLFSRSGIPGSGIRLTSDELSEFASKERLTGPRFAGMTASGVAIQFSAAEASPRITGGPAFDATDLRARVEMPSGELIRVTARRGSVDSLAKTAELSDGITLETSDGYVAKSDGLSFALDRLKVESHGAITATGPQVNITAGAMSIHLDETRGSEESPGYLLVFKNGVKLIYTP